MKQFMLFVTIVVCAMLVMFILSLIPMHYYRHLKAFVNQTWFGVVLVIGFCTALYYNAKSHEEQNGSSAGLL